LSLIEVAKVDNALM